MSNLSQVGFDQTDYEIIEYLQSCHMQEEVAQIFVASLSQIYPHMPPLEMKEHGLSALRVYLEQEYSISAVDAFVDLLAKNGFLDHLTPSHLEVVICSYIENQVSSHDEVLNLKARLPAIMPLLSRKLDNYGEYRRQHYLHEPAQWAISKESKESFLQAIKDADGAIKLPAYSGETFFESWKVGSLLIEKVRRGVDVKILFVHPELGSRLEGKELAQTLTQKTVAMAEHFLHEVERQLKSDKQNRHRKLGKIEIRWIREEKYGYFTGLLTYTKHQSPGVAVARLNIHRIGLERATVGLMLGCDNKIGDTSLFKILETYFDEAWKRAEPLSRTKRWLSQIVNFSTGYYGVVLTSLIIAGTLFFVNSIIANILVFIYPVVLTLLWRRHDNTK